MFKLLQAKTILNYGGTTSFLLYFLTAQQVKIENNYTLVFVKQINKVNGEDVVEMSNGLSYFINNENNWEMSL